MTVTELRKRAEELEAEGFGDVQVTLINEIAWRKHSQPRPYGLYAAYEFEPDTWLGALSIRHDVTSSFLMSKTG